MAAEKYVQIDPKILQRGMYPDTDLFYVTQDRPVLLAKGGNLIDSMSLNRLQYIIATGQPIYVTESTAQGLEEQAKFFVQLNHETEQHYKETAEACKDFLEDVRARGQVDMKSVVRLVTMTTDVLKTMDVSFLLQYAHFMDQMDDDLQSHSTNVALLNGLMGQWMGLPEEDIHNLITVGFMHDLGKTKIRQEILHKPSRLTDEEFEIMKMHTIYSYDMAKEAGVEDVEMLMGIRGHHERLNGSGYPDGLHGDDVSAFARLTAISDIYDAMVSDHTYRDANTPFVVLNEFYNAKFSNLDMDFVDLFMEHMITELNGKYVILSNGHMGQISYIDKHRVAYPLVTSQGNVIETSPTGVRVVSVCGAGF